MHVYTIDFRQHEATTVATTLATICLLLAAGRGLMKSKLVSFLSELYKVLQCFQMFAVVVIATAAGLTTNVSLCETGSFKSQTTRRDN